LYKEKERIFLSYYIKIMHKYSFLNLLNEYNKNKDVIQAYFRGQPVEGMNGSKSAKDAVLVGGMTLGVFLFVFALSLGLLIWAVWATITYWSKLSETAKIFVVVSWFFMPPVLPLIIVYVAKSS
jgi:hypothetical protein